MTLSGQAIIYKTTNIGVDWVPLPFASASTLLNGVCFEASVPTGMVFGSTFLPQWGPYAARTTDGGLTWTPATLPNTPAGTALNGGSLLNGDIGYLVGGSPFGNGIILHTTNGGATFVEDQPNDVPTAFSLSQNYPNPFNPSTTITYDLPLSSHVTLRVYDVLGREVATLVDGQESAGSKSVNLDAGNMASGVYLYRLQAGNFSQVRKMLVVK